HLLAQLFTAAAQQPASSIAVQFNACRHRFHPEAVRTIRKNLAELELERRLPLRVREHQRQVVNKVDDAAFLLDEFVGADPYPFWNEVTLKLNSCYDEAEGSLGFSSALMSEKADDGLTDLVTTGFPSVWFHEIPPLAQLSRAVRLNE